MTTLLLSVAALATINALCLALKGQPKVARPGIRKMAKAHQTRRIVVSF